MRRAGRKKTSCWNSDQATGSRCWSRVYGLAGPLLASQTCFPLQQSRTSHRLRSKQRDTTGASCQSSRSIWTSGLTQLRITWRRSGTFSTTGHDRSMNTASPHDGTRTAPPMINARDVGAPFASRTTPRRPTRNTAEPSLTEFGRSRCQTQACERRRRDMLSPEKQRTASASPKRSLG